MAGFDEALQESVVFLDHFADLPDPRQLIKVIYPLDEIQLTGQDNGDASQVEPPLDRIDGPIGQFTADGAYDGKPTYDTVISQALLPQSSFRRVPTRSNQATMDLPAKGTNISPPSAGTAG